MKTYKRQYHLADLTARNVDEAHRPALLDAVNRLNAAAAADCFASRREAVEAGAHAIFAARCGQVAVLCRVTTR